MSGYLKVGAIGLGLGLVLSRIGFSSWDQVHAMFVFEDPRMMLSFGVAAAILVPFWVLVQRLTDARWTPRSIHKGTLAGGLLFGAGWALSGACPGIVWVQLGEGQLGAGLTLAGMVAGNWLYSVVHERYLRWPTGSCADV